MIVAATAHVKDTHHLTPHDPVKHKIFSKVLADVIASSKTSTVDHISKELGATSVGAVGKTLAGLLLA